MVDKVNFTPLTIDEIQKKIDYLSKNKVGLIIWEKGSAEKEEIFVSHFNPELNRASFINNHKTKSVFHKKNVLINFKIKGLNFFGHGEVSYDSSLNTNILNLKDKFYKCERRRNFRLHTYLVHEVTALFKIDENFEEEERAVLLDFASQLKDNKDIFDQFVSLIPTGEPATNESQAVFRVYDISVSGIAIIAGKLEGQYFSKDKELKNLEVTFNGQTFLVPESKVVYIINHNQTHKEDVEQFKVGIHFNDLPESVDSELGKIINNNLKESDIKRVFEDFLK